MVLSFVNLLEADLNVIYAVKEKSDTHYQREVCHFTRKLSYDILIKQQNKETNKNIKHMDESFTVIPITGI